MLHSFSVKLKRLIDEPARSTMRASIYLMVRKPGEERQSMRPEIGRKAGKTPPAMWGRSGFRGSAELAEVKNSDLF
jgi:hypothetical protein